MRLIKNIDISDAINARITELPIESGEIYVALNKDKELYIRQRLIEIATNLDETTQDSYKKYLLQYTNCRSCPDQLQQT